MRIAQRMMEQSVPSLPAMPSRLEVTRTVAFYLGSRFGQLLEKNAGWKQTSFPCSKGSVVIWTDSQGPYHAAISRGDGTIDQHNPNRCGTSGSWGTQYCLSPPSFTETANQTVVV